MSKTTFYRGLSHFFAEVYILRLPQKNRREASEVPHLQHGIIIMSEIKNDDSFTERDCTWKGVRCPAPVMQKGCPRPQVSRMPRLTRNGNISKNESKLSFTFCASLRSQNAHGHLKSHFIREFTGQMPCPKNGTPVLCEPAQSTWAWTSHTSHFTQEFTGKRPEIRWSSLI